MEINKQNELVTDMINQIIKDVAESDKMEIYYCEEDKVYKGIIPDGVGNTLECVFTDDGLVKIDTKGLDFIVLGEFELNCLDTMIEDASESYEFDNHYPSHIDNNDHYPPHIDYDDQED